MGFNTYASFYTSIHGEVDIAPCADSGNPELYGKNMTGKIVCLPKTTGSTSAGAVWQRVAQTGVAPKAMLIVTVDQLGGEFLEFVKDGDWIVIREDGTVAIQ
jgi:predicted aconitase with swiveling domain